MKERNENEKENRECPVCPTQWIIRTASDKPVVALLVLTLLLAAMFWFGIL